MKKLVSRKVLLETPIFTVSDNEVIDPEDIPIRRIMVEHEGSTVVMPVDNQDRVCLVRQYRYPALDYLWELPAGKIDPGETALEGARRELIEETGLRARRWKKLIEFLPSPGFQQEKMTIFLARDLVAGDRVHIDDENLQFKWFPRTWIERQIGKGVIRDAKTIIAMYAFEHFVK